MAVPLHRAVLSFIDIGGPVEAVGHDVGEAPAALRAFVDGELLDVIAVGAAQHAGIELLHRIEPEDMPGIDTGIVDAEGRAVEIRRGADRIAACAAGWCDPDILDGAA